MNKPATTTLTPYPDKETIEGENINTQCTTPLPLGGDLTKGEKKRRMDQDETPPLPILPSTPTFNPQIPQSQINTPSFLSKNIQAYTSSPTPQPSDDAQIFTNINLDAICSTSDEEMSIEPVHPSKTPNISSLRDCLLAVKERSPQINANTAMPKDPIDKYTKQPKKEIGIYYSHPTAAFDNININQVCSWENRPGGKLLAHPFGHEVRTPELQSKIKKKIFAALAKITMSENIGFYAPKPGFSLWEMPTVFLIYNLTDTQKQNLLNREIWSSKNITFRITTMEPVCPDYLFSIYGLTTKSTDEVKEAILQVWDSQDSQDFLSSLHQTFPEPMRHNAKTILQNFMNSLKVTMLDMNDPGNASAPTFNIYIKANLISDDSLWCILHNYYFSQEYALPF